MLEGLSHEPGEAAGHAELVAEKIRAALNRPYVINNHERYYCSSSIGISLFHEQTDTSDNLLKYADAALYQAKNAGRDTICFHAPAMPAMLEERAALETDLRQGLRQQEFMLYYQAQVDRDGRLTGAEALLRWLHPQRGLVSPTEFIPLAEETGLILPIGLWVLETACAQLAAWASLPDVAHLTLAVNVSARQFHHPGFVEQVLTALGAGQGYLFGRPVPVEELR
ncbi:MAG: EAL domain-containing protein [Methylococcaceae bacterium]|nr:MAG: EAL domain-containing protein [Methylococcaceae bacterium]